MLASGQQSTLWRFTRRSAATILGRPEDSIARWPALAAIVSLGEWTPVPSNWYATSAPKLPTTPPPASAPEGASPPLSIAAPAGPPKEWPIIRRFAIESALKSYGASVLKEDVFLLHGPRGVGKQTAVKAVLQEWAKPPHSVCQVNLYAALSPSQTSAEPCPPWLNRLYPDTSADASEEADTATSTGTPKGGSQSQATTAEATVDGSPPESTLSLFHPQTERLLRTSLEDALLSAAKVGVAKRVIKMEDVFWALTWRRHVEGALERYLEMSQQRAPDNSVSFRRLYSPAGIAYAKLANAKRGADLKENPGFTEKTNFGGKIDSKGKTVSEGKNGLEGKTKAQKESLDVTKGVTLDPDTARLWLEALFNVPALVKRNFKNLDQTKLALEALKLASSVLEIQEGWGPRKEAGATAWSLLLIDLLSACAVPGKWEPKLVIHGIELLRQAPVVRTRSRKPGRNHAVNGAHFHDQLLLDMSRRATSLPVILTATDRYYSSDFDSEKRWLDTRVTTTEYSGWTGAEAAVHLVPRLLSTEQWARLQKSMGLNARHLAEFHSLWADRASALPPAERDTADDASAFVRTVEEYTRQLGRESFRPVMSDVVRRVAERSRAAWERRRGRGRGVLMRWDDVRWHRWATLQVLDFLRGMQRARFVVNYVNLAASEFLEDEVARALLATGLLYQQRDPPYIRPLTPAFQRLMEAWLREQWVDLPLQQKLSFAVLRLAKGRYYRHLVKVSMGPKDFVMDRYRPM